MAKRKSKKPQQDDTSILFDSSAPQSKKRINSYASPALLFIIIFTVGAFLMGCFFVQQQHSIDELTGSLTTMQTRITNLQRVMTDAQTGTGMGLEEKIFALEEAQKQAQERAEVALATSEKLKNSTLYSQLLDLHDEIDTRLTELKQVSLSITNLQAMFKNQFEEFEAMKESVEASLRSSSAAAENVAGLTKAVAGAFSRADEQVASVEALNAQFEEQASELDELKETMHLHSVALQSNNQEVAALKELVEAQQAIRTQILEEMLGSVLMTLDEQFFTSQALHSSVMAQLQTFHTQLTNAPSWSMKLDHEDEESSAAEEFIFTAAENATEVQEMLGDEEEKTEQHEDEDEAEEEEEEEEEGEEEEEEEAKEEEEEDVVQEEQPLKQEVEVDATEEQEGEETTEEEEEITPEEQEDEEVTGQSEEQDVAGETAEEQDPEETVYGHVLDVSLEEDVSEEVMESWETVDEESAELNSGVFMDENEDDK